MKAYIAGPMSGLPWFNIPAFDTAASDLRSKGWDVVSPVELDDPRFREVCLVCSNGSMEELHHICKAWGVPVETWGDLLARDVKLLADDGIEAVVALPGWESSKGAKLETYVAKLCGLKVLRYPTLEADEGITARTWLLKAEPHARYRMTPEGPEEIRRVDPKTGGEKCSKDERYDLLPWRELDEVARVYAAGAEKYSAHNWRKGYAWSLNYASLIRHARAFWEGESVDSESKTHHLASVCFHALALMYFEKHHAEKDDRYAA